MEVPSASDAALVVLKAYNCGGLAQRRLSCAWQWGFLKPSKVAKLLGKGQHPLSEVM